MANGMIHSTLTLLLAGRIVAFNGLFCISQPRQEHGTTYIELESWSCEEKIFSLLARFILIIVAVTS
jgi:hypothetical protein